MKDGGIIFRSFLIYATKVQNKENNKKQVLSSFSACRGKTAFVFLLKLGDGF